MASIKPATDRPRQPPKSRFWSRLLSAVSVSAMTLATVAALALLLMMSDPVTAAAVMEEGDLMPVIFALLEILSKALISVISTI